jgi:hypothetical protein
MLECSWKSRSSSGFRELVVVMDASGVVRIGMAVRARAILP